MQIGIYRYSEIERATCAHFRIEQQDLQSPKRSRRHCRPRYVAAYLARQFTPLSSPQIGDRLHRDHSTILGAVKRARRLITESPDFREDMAAVVERLQALPRSNETILKAIMQNAPAAAAKMGD